MRTWPQKINLFWVLSRMHLRSSDYRSFLGALWSFLGPVLTFAVLYLISIDRFGRQIPNYSVKLLTGIVLINFFLRIVQVSIAALAQCREIVSYSLTPSEILILASYTVPVLKFLVEIALCVGLACLLGLFSWSSAGFLVLGVAAFFVLAAGFGLLVAVLNSLAGDVAEIWGILCPLFFFISPVFYTVDMLSPWGRWLVLGLNPLTPFLLAFQTLVARGPVPYFSTATAALAAFHTALAAGLGYYLLKRFEKQIFEDL